MNMGVCKKMKNILDSILLLGNMLMIHKNTTRSHYVMLGLVKLEPEMSYDMQVRLRKTRKRFIVTKYVRVMEKQNAYPLWRRKMRMRFGEAKHACVLEKQNMHALWRTTKNSFSALLGK